MNQKAYASASRSYSSLHSSVNNFIHTTSSTPLCRMTALLTDAMCPTCDLSPILRSPNLPARLVERYGTHDSYDDGRGDGTRRWRQFEFTTHEIRKRFRLRLLYDQLLLNYTELRFSLKENISVLRTVGHPDSDHGCQVLVSAEFNSASRDNVPG